MPDVFIYPLAIAAVLFLALWPLSVRWQDVSIVDGMWGPGFIIQLVVAMIAAGNGDTRMMLLAGIIGLWSLRLTWTLLARRRREGREDPRYTSMRQSWGPAFWWKSAFVVFLLQAVLQWLVMLGPIAAVAAAPVDIGVLAWIGLVISLGGLCLETAADRELDRFKLEAPAGALLTTGLRAHVRHPNYTGEIIFWTGIALILFDGYIVLGILPPVLITLFLTKVSGAPLLDERLSETRPEYARYRKQVPAFLPFVHATRS